MHIARLVATLILLSGLTSAHAAATLTDITQLHRTGKAEQALAELDAYLAALPKGSWGRNVTQARFLKGIILAEQKRTAEAIQVFSRLTQDYPDLPEPYNNLAAIYIAQGKYEAARDTLERAMHIDPAYAAMHANLDDVYAKLSAQAYESSLRDTAGKSAPERLKELCDNYGSMARQASGRKIAPRADSDVHLLPEIQSGRTAAAKPPAHIDIDEMAMESPDTPPQRVEVPPAASTVKPVELEPAKNPAADQQAILAVLHGWAHAWSTRNVEAYLAYYATDFKLPAGATRAAWAAQRRERISKPKSIRVTAEAPQVTRIDSTHARVSFRQSYRSDTLQSSGRKTLLLVKNGGKWLIQEEKVGV